MKNITILGTLILMLSATSLSAQNVGAEVKAYLKKKGYSISTEQYAYLSKGEKAGHTKKFYSGLTYAIIAYSEEYGVKDIDIYLYDDDGSVLVKDTDSQKLAVVTYAPYVSRDMRVVVKNYESESSVKDYKCKIIIAYKTQR